MKKLLTIIATLSILTCLTGCNKQVLDLDYKYDYAIIDRYDGEEKVALKSWIDYNESDMIQVTSTDGKVYLTHSSRVILIKE